MTTGAKPSPASAPLSGMSLAGPTRLAFVDNIRWVMIVLVVSMHAAVTYSHLGSWYFMEDPKPGKLGTILFAYYQMGLQAFFMGLLFLIAGYFVPPAFDRKGAARFLRDRFVRLGIPALFYMLVIQPLVVWGLLGRYNGVADSFATAYLRYIVSLRFLGGSGPMWFAVALFIFCLIYAAARKLGRGSGLAPGAHPLPTDRQVAGLAVIMGLCTFLMRIVQPMGTSILNMQLCFFSQYILLFVVGLIAWRRDWLWRIPYPFGMRWFQLALFAGSLVWVAAIVAIVATHTEDRIAGGFTWQSAVVCFWEAFFCLGICLGIIVIFRDRFNRQGRFAKWMTDNCFSVYLFHPPVLIAITLAMHRFAAPKPLKFLVATFLGAAVTCLASDWIFRRAPLLRRML